MGKGHWLKDKVLRYLISMERHSMDLRYLLNGRGGGGERRLNSEANQGYVCNIPQGEGGVSDKLREGESLLVKGVPHFVLSSEGNLDNGRL